MKELLLMVGQCLVWRMMVKMLGLEDVELSLRFGELGLEGTD
jgi:hypothetical protein